MITDQTIDHNVPLKSDTPPRKETSSPFTIAQMFILGLRMKRTADVTNTEAPYPEEEETQTCPHDDELKRARAESRAGVQRSARINTSDGLRR